MLRHRELLQVKRPAMDVIEEEEEDQDGFHRYQEDDGDDATDISAASWRSLAQPDGIPASSSSTETGVSLGERQMPTREVDAADGMIGKAATDAAVLGLFDSDFIRQPDDSASSTASELILNEDEPQTQPEPASADHAVVATTAARSASGGSQSCTTAGSDARASNDNEPDDLYLGSQSTKVPVDGSLGLDGSIDQSIGAVASQLSSRRVSEEDQDPASELSADNSPVADTCAVVSHVSVLVHNADVRQPESEHVALRDQRVQDGTAPEHFITSPDSPAPHLYAQPAPRPTLEQQGTRSAAGRQPPDSYAAVLPAPGDIGEGRAIAAAQATLRQQLLSTAAWLEGELAQLTKAAQVHNMCEAPLRTAWWCGLWGITLAACCQITAATGLLCKQPQQPATELLAEQCHSSAYSKTEAQVPYSTQ